MLFYIYYLISQMLKYNNNTILQNLMDLKFDRSVRMNETAILNFYVLTKQDWLDEELLLDDELYNYLNVSIV